MSAARKLAIHEPFESETTAVPTARPAVRPAPKKRFKTGTYVIAGSVWLAVMALSFQLVQKNADLRMENGEIMRLREEAARLEQANLALEGRIANQVSVAEVEKWARSKGMKPPSGNVQVVQAKPEAVAVRSVPAPADSQAAKGGRSFWESLWAKLGSTLNAKQ